MQRRRSSRAFLAAILFVAVVALAATAKAQTPTPTPGGNCCAPHAGPECDDATCESCVCDVDPLCCAPGSATGWDEFCVAHAIDPKECASDCPCITPTPTPGGDCCSPHAGPSCNEGACRDCVCEVDGVCCTEEWDAACVVIAGDECAKMCPCAPVPTDTPAPTPTPGGDCCAGHAGPQCDDMRCETCVCEVDAACCSDVWDTRCAEEAATECATECTCEPAAECCSAHEGVGCGDMRCQDCVCATDPNCCDKAWDAQCASEAAKECAAECPCDSAGDCCAAHEGIGCGVSECQDCVCGIDSECCSEGWDARCVEEATNECAPSCPCDMTPCCSGHGGLGCGEDVCENCVCAFDEACCTDSWDQRCAEEAQEECAPRCSCEAASDCCVAREDPGCTDEGCANCVCDLDEVCCNDIWDPNCVSIATDECADTCSCVAKTNCCLRGREDPGCDDVECAECVCGIDDICCDDVWDDQCVDRAADDDECNASCKCVCVGDCSNDGTITIDELVKAVDFAIAGTLPDECLLIDSDINGTVSIDELILAVTFALEGCAP